MLNALDLPAEDGESNGLVLRLYPHNLQVGTRLRAEPVDSVIGVCMSLQRNERHQIR